MITKNTIIKDLPKHIKLATYDSNDEELFLCEYTLATLIYNGATFNQLFEVANEIEDKKERELIREIIIDMVLVFINLNPEYAYIINNHKNVIEFLNNLSLKFSYED
ncbi:hypothetical protein [Flavobacterium sp. 3-210]